jgi:hypothetical protein
VAIRENLDLHGKQTMVTINGSQYGTDTLDLARWVARCR